MRVPVWGVTVGVAAVTVALAVSTVAHADTGAASGGSSGGPVSAPTALPTGLPTGLPLPTAPPSGSPTKPPKPPKTSQPPKPTKPPKSPKTSQPPKPTSTGPQPGPASPSGSPTDAASEDSGKDAKKHKPDEKPPPPVPTVPQAHTLDEGPDFGLWGVDVSKWQHPHRFSMDWPLLAGAGDGFTFTFVKASEGAGTHGEANRFYAEDVAAAKAAGAYVGAYHYAGPGLPVRKDALTEARHAVASAGVPGVGDLPLALDMESNPDGLSPHQMAKWAVTWLEEVERLTGRTPIFYTYPSFFTANVFPDPVLADYPLWIAHYGLDVTEPWVPEPWTSWTFWQFSSEGDLPGTQSAIDLDVFSGSAAELALLAGRAYTGDGVDASGVSLLGDAMLSALTPPGA